MTRVLDQHMGGRPGVVAACHVRGSVLGFRRHDSNFESCIWRVVSTDLSHHPQEVLLAQFSLYVHKGDLNLHSFIIDSFWWVDFTLQGATF